MAFTVFLASQRCINQKMYLILSTSSDIIQEIVSEAFPIDWNDLVATGCSDNFLSMNLVKGDGEDKWRIYISGRDVEIEINSGRLDFCSKVINFMALWGESD